MHARSHRVVLARQEVDVLVADDGGQRREVVREFRAERVVPFGELRGELQQPCPAIHALPAAGFVVEVGDLAEDVVRGQ